MGKIGLSGIIEGCLSIGGLSSSASVIIFLSALCKVNDIHMEPMELILTAKAAENQYVGDTIKDNAIEKSSNQMKEYQSLKKKLA